MYKLLLTWRYLRRKLTPFFALLAVMLCTAMLIVVTSIMGGFLDLLNDAGQRLVGDVAMTAGASGFAHYDELISEIEKLPEADAATPLILSYGLLRLPGDITKTVEVCGIRGRQQDRVTDYGQTLYWNKQTFAEHFGEPMREDLQDPQQAGMDLSLLIDETIWPRPDNQPGAAESRNERPPVSAAVTGIEINPFNYRTNEGKYRFSRPLLGGEVILTVLPILERGDMSLEPARGRFQVVNEFHSGLYEVDANRVYVPFDVLQKMMLMEATTRIAQNDDGSPVLDNEGQPKIIGTTPARCTEVHISARGVSSDQLREAVERSYEKFAAKHPDMPPADFMTIATWQQRAQTFIKAVENEKGLMTALFGIISVVAIVMVTVIFYMIVLEKTRDIGILRSIGASQPGVASIFLTYAAAVGTIGAALAALIAWLIVKYVNEIHAWLGSQFGIVIWDRKVYFFENIPNRVDPLEMTFFACAAIAASVIGALIPAFIAARVNPIEALRYE